VGTILKPVKLSEDLLDKINSPVIICSTSQKVQKIARDYTKIQINQILAQQLLKTSVDGRSMRVVDEFNKVVEMHAGKIFIMDYDMLFNPAYHIDVIKLFIDLARRRKFLIQWCGSCDGINLTYSEPGLTDYHLYKIDDYNITCII